MVNLQLFSMSVENIYLAQLFFLFFFFSILGIKYSGPTHKASALPLKPCSQPFWNFCCCVLFIETRSQYITVASLKLAILLPQPP
jgi:hypothetical protein